MRIKLNKSEAAALNRLRGLPPDAHMLVMCMETTASGGVLDGDDDAFEDLLGFISEELAEGMASARDTRALASLAVKINPESDDWLGM